MTGSRAERYVLNDGPQSVTLKDAIAVTTGPLMREIVTLGSFDWVCQVCGWHGIGHRTERQAKREGARHLKEHPELWPKHDDGSPCFHTRSDCMEHGSCMDCDACKLDCECN